MKRILLTVFCGTSAERLVRDVDLGPKYEVLCLPSDKIKDSELLIKALRQEEFDYIISLGQRPNIKNKVHIETTAKKGDEVIRTSFDCEKLKRSLEQNGLPAKCSNNAGTSFCNELYWNGLRHLKDKNTDTQMVFVHVPFEKNIADVNDFRSSLFEGIEETLL